MLLFFAKVVAMLDLRAKLVLVIAFVLSICLSACGNSSSSDGGSNQNPSSGSLIWAKQFGVESYVTEGNAVSADASGNLYVVGTTRGTFAGESVTNNYSYFIAKYNSSGTLSWLRQVGYSDGAVYGHGVSTDSLGNAYVFGDTSTNISGESEVNSIISYFIAKYSESGLLLWTHQAGAESSITNGSGISTDSLGNSYVTGSTLGSINGESAIGEVDAFVAKYSESGLLLWTTEFGAESSYASGNGVNVDSSGNVYVAGHTSGNISGESLVVENTNYFIAKFSESGASMWTRQVGPESGVDTETVGNAVSTDLSGNAYIVGYTDAAISGESRIGYTDYFIAKYSSDGSLLWTLESGAESGTVPASSVTVDLFGNIYVAGLTDVQLSGESQVGIVDYFIAKYNQNGLQQWLTQVGSQGGDTEANGVTADAAGKVYIGGTTDVGISGESEVGDTDYFIAKYYP